MSRPGGPRRQDATPTEGLAPGSGAQPMQVSRFVRETLEAYASEAVADEILRNALGLASLSQLPTTSAELSQFLDVHLVQAATVALGSELAHAVQQRLKPLVTVVSQMEPAPTERPTLVDPGAPYDPFSEQDRTPTREFELKPFSVVLVAGRDADVATRLKAHVDPRTAVIPIDAAPTLVRDLRLLRRQERMLIIDVRRPHTLIDALRAEPALVDGAVVVLWGAGRGEDAEFRQTFPKARVVRCGTETSVEDLAAMIRIGPGR